jgi:hypothetical protein
MSRFINAISASTISSRVSGGHSLSMMKTVRQLGIHRFFSSRRFNNARLLYIVMPKP